MLKDKHITPFQGTIAYILLISELLTSCSWHATIPPIQQQKRFCPPTAETCLRKRLKIGEYNKDTEQDIRTASVLFDELDERDAALSQSNQNRIFVSSTTKKTNKTGYLRPQPTGLVHNKRGTPFPLNPASLQPTHTKSTKFPKERPITAPPNHSTSGSQESVLIKPTKPAIEASLSYGPYTIKRSK